MTRPFDHGELNIPGRLKNLDTEIQRRVRRQRSENLARQREARERQRASKAERPTFTRDDLEDAFAVKISGKWHRVIRVSAKTVTVPGLIESEPHRYPFNQIEAVA